MNGARWMYLFAIIFLVWAALALWRGWFGVRPGLRPHEYWVMWFELAASLVVCLLAFAMSGCSTAYSNNTRPYVMPSSKARPATTVYRQCDAKGCRMYDARGERRRECEQGWVKCRVY